MNDRTLLVVIAALLVANLSVSAGAIFRPPQVISVQALVQSLGTAEARAQLWEARATELAKQLQSLQQAKPGK